MGNTYSDEIIIESGVPQGSVLGSVLFNIYICSLYRFVYRKCNFEIQGFADDHQLYVSFCTDDQYVMLGDNIRNVLCKVKAWMNCFFLKLNQEKTKIIVFAPPRLKKIYYFNKWCFY